MNRLDAALAYARNGWFIFPLAPDAKVPHAGLHDGPVGDGGFKRATADEATVRKWWTAWPDANIGLWPGPSGLLVVDIDNAEGQRIAMELGLLAEPTLVALSVREYHDGTNRMRPGRHLYFRHPGGHIGNHRINGILEVKADSGYVVLPPSEIRTRTGSIRQYQFVSTVDELRAVPASALRAIRENGGPTTATPLPLIVEGTRNDTLTSLAGTMRRRGASEQAILAALREENRRCDPPLVDSELQRIAHSVAGYAPATAEAEPRNDVAEWDLPLPIDRSTNLPSFPDDALPDWLQRFVREVAEATQTPVDLAGMLSLGALAACVAGKVEIRVKCGYCEPLNLFVVAVLPPGNRKSSVFATIIRPIQEFEHDERERLGPDIQAARSAFKIKEGELRNAEKDASKAKEEEREAHRERAQELAQEFYGTPEPVLPRFICDDTTPEKLVDLLHEQGGRMAVFSPEGDIFEIMAGRYSRNARPNFAVFQKGHAGDGLYVDRIGRKSEFVERPALTLAVAVQPDVIHQLSSKPGFRGRGLLGRLLYAIPTSLLGGRNTRSKPLSEDAVEDYRLGLRYLLRLPADTDDAGNRRPQILRLDPDADAALAEFERWIEPQLAPGGALGSITDWSGKLFGATARIAGLLYLAKNAAHPDRWTEIDADTALAAIRIAKYLIPHALAAFNMMGADETIESARTLLRWLHTVSEQEFTRRDAFNAHRGRYRRVIELDPGLCLLEEHGFIRAMEMPKTRGRPASRRYSINPHLRSHNAHNDHNPGVE